jgi:hypothetical protein
MSAGMDKAAARALALLSAGPALVEPAVSDGFLLLRNGSGTIAVDRAVLEQMAGSGAIVRNGKQLSATPAGLKAALRENAPDGFRRQHRDVARVSLDDGTGVVSAEINLAESPLGQLMRRKDKDGRPFLSRAEFEAGERLRSDYTRGQIMPRLGANWEASVSAGRRDGSGGIADLTDAALAARLRVDRALKAVGPELSGLLVDVCCFLKGLETVERERAWPARSAKMLLKTALGILARHYHPPREGAVRPSVLHWGAEDYRPELR